MEKRPVREELWASLDNMGEPLARAFRLLLEALKLAARPFSEMEVDSAQTTDVRIDQPGQIIKGRVGPVLETPSPDSDLTSSKEKGTLGMACPISPMFRGS
jgi:hypothetical protein